MPERVRFTPSNAAKTNVERKCSRTLLDNLEKILAGVAGIHRLAEPLEQLRAFDPDCVIAAGMEGALPTVISGLVSVPVIGLPTSTGYGGDGTAAILGMLQSCSPGLSVVSVDNGVGAGATAALITNRAARYRARETGG